MTKPIRPDEINKLSIIPDGVIEVFNNLITKHYKNGFAEFTVAEAVKAVCEKFNCEAHVPYDGGWLEIESIYRKVGWRVECDTPAYNENYPATYKFTRKGF